MGFGRDKSVTTNIMAARKRGCTLFWPAAHDAGAATNVDLRERILEQKLEAAADAVRSEGWKWVETSTTFPAGFQTMKRFYPEQIELPEEVLEALHTARAEFERLIKFMATGHIDDAVDTKLVDVETRIKALSTRTEAYSSIAFEQAGAFVYIDYYGRIAIERGFVRPEDNEPWSMK